MKTKKDFIKYLSIFLGLVILFFSTNQLSEKKHERLYGEKYSVIHSSQLYWFPSNNIENISYYMIRKGTTVYCKYKNSSEDFYFCFWKFSFFEDPITGWIKSKNLEK